MLCPPMQIMKGLTERGCPYNQEFDYLLNMATFCVVKNNIFQIPGNKVISHLLQGALIGMLCSYIGAINVLVNQIST